MKKIKPKIQKSTDVVVLTKKGKAIRFPRTEINNGVEYIKTIGGDSVLRMIILTKDVEEIFIITRNGFGKRFLLSNLKIHKVGGEGIRVMNVTAETGEVVGATAVKKRFISVMHTDGKFDKINMKLVPILSFKSKGEKVMNLLQKERVAGFI